MSDKARKVKKYLTVSAVLVMFLNAHALAQDLRDYRCTIDRVATSASSASKALEAVRKRYFGKGFTVDRRTGIMAGALKNSYVTRPEVIDHGSAENSYKVVTTLRREQGAGAGTNVHVLIVSEYETGARKPFVFLDNSDVYFGTCVHV